MSPKSPRSKRTNPSQSRQQQDRQQQSRQQQSRQPQGHQQQSREQQGRQRQEAERARRAAVTSQRARARRRRNVVGVAAGAILVLLAALVIYRSNLSGGGDVSSTPVPPTVLDALANVPAERFSAIGTGGVVSLPTPIRADVLRGQDNLPLIVYIGAEYCPYCAAERWPLIVALNRFGSFTGLKLARSASDDVYPNTPTFTFYGATYTSQYVAFDAVETETSQRSGSGYQRLQTPTAEQEALLRKYDAPPYVPAQSAGAIPFLDVANQYVLVGSTYDVGTLQGKTWEQIAQSLSDPSSAQAKSILGSANIITAAICQATGDNPASVCGQPEIKSIEADLAKTAVPK